MLEIPFLRANKEKAAKGLAKKLIKDPIEKIEDVLSLDDDRKAIQSRLDAILAEANNKAKEIGQLMKTGKKEEAEEAKNLSKQLREQSGELKTELKAGEEALNQALYLLPNIPYDTVPEGKKAEDNEILKTVGDIPTLHDKALPHWELIKQYNIIDFELGNKISGAGFPIYKGKGARLQRALINFFLDEAEAQGYSEVQVPILVNENSCLATGQLPDKEGQMYFMPTDNLYAIPTGEVPITNIYRDVIVKEEELPIKHVGFTPCFRREAGSWGADVRGLNRLHQFDKVEIVQVTRQEDSYETLESMNTYVQSLLEKLGLPYRVLKLCGGDMTFTSSLTYDMEVYSAAQKRWLEVSSVSNFETYQSNRLKLRYKNKDGKKFFAHTLNGSALALPRIVASILENNQTENGIVVPEVLRKYTGFNIIN
ncbi:MAG: serine--tRNA ligase [Cyclobacteriaceae bacterium]